MAGLHTKSRLFSMMTWTDHVDESYNNRTLCVGGWMAPSTVWPTIEQKWQERIAYENRKSAQKGFPPISRYHATYLANLKGEFAAKNGWNVDRQIKFTKRLCEILTTNGICAGMVFGGSLSDVQRHLPPEADTAIADLYRLSMMMHLIQVAGLMRDHFSNDRVTVYYDSDRKFGPIARDAFDRFMKEDAVEHLSKYFLAMGPMGWEDCTLLQAADLVAYEGMKRIDGRTRSNDAVRKSLQALMGGHQLIAVAHFSDQNFQDMLKMEKNEREGRPLYEGVETAPTDDLP